MSRADSPLRERVIFIVGARRSGTNWLERILTAHPEVVAVPTETHLFSHGIQPLAERFQHANPGAPSIARTFIDRDAFLDSMRDLVDIVLLETLNRHGAHTRFVVERTPWHASHLPLIADVYPDARVLNIIRDGRDIARSLIAMPWGPETMEEAATEWRKAVIDARAGGALLGDRYREIVYETLLADPRVRMEELFDWLGLDLPEETWGRIRVEAGSQFNVDPGSPGVRAEKWRESLSEADLRTFERIAGDQLDELGYARGSVASGGEPALARARRVINAESLKSAARAIRRPRVATGTRLGPEFGKRLHSDQVAHNELVANFERDVADGAETTARASLSPNLQVRIDDGGPLEETRGEVGIEALLRALADHRRRDMRILSGQTHATPYGFTTVITYALDDDSRWARTMTYDVRRRKIAAVGLYRHELRT